VPLNPSELLTSKRFERLMKSLGETFDRIVIALAEFDRMKKRPVSYSKTRLLKRLRINAETYQASKALLGDAIVAADPGSIEISGDGIDLTEKARLANELRTRGDELERTNQRLRTINGEIGRPAAADSMSVARRRSRVSALFAEMTQWSACLRNDGAFAENHAHAASFAWKRAASSGPSSGSRACSNE